jgi:ribosome recycling factor
MDLSQQYQTIVEKLPLTTVEQAVSNLALARRDLDQANTALRAMREAFERTPEYQDALRRLETAQQIAGGLESELRSLAVEEYETTGEKHIHRAISIRVNTELEYNPQQALDWCTIHLPKAIAMDKKLFEKHARAVLETAPLSFVTVNEKPSATIATDLGDYILSNNSPV